MYVVLVILTEVLYALDTYSIWWQMIYYLNDVHVCQCTVGIIYVTFFAVYTPFSVWNIGPTLTWQHKTPCKMSSVTFCVYLHAHIFCTFSFMMWNTVCKYMDLKCLIWPQLKRTNWNPFCVWHFNAKTCMLFANYRQSGGQMNGHLWVVQFKFIVICCSHRQSFP